MNMQDFIPGCWEAHNMVTSAYSYMVDSMQRHILFADIMRKRGNEYIEHVKAGQPPVLVFDYEMVLDGREMDPPVNYALLSIIDRRKGNAKKGPTNGSGKLVERRRKAGHYRDEPVDPHKRPIVVIDPRAGHGPGIGGSKLDSQVGVALNACHPVYFVMFYPDPEPGQTLANVQQAEVMFLEEVKRRHPEAELPAVIGNCQAGWAAALIGADRPDVTGPMVFNGSPLSYWGGTDGANPMRYRGGLCGGSWMTSLWCDLGNGHFDGANLVSGFEDLNPANTIWTKQYNVYARVDTEEQRYLNFEKWWGGFFKMNREEIHFIVDSLFVGNELEQGHLRLDDNRHINLKNFKDPIVVFASAGDNITPPQQALNWIYKVYETTDEIKRNGQVIVYILHDKIGHLGIFVGSKVAKKEHKAIIGTVDMIDYLAPGLYEMVITDDKDGSGNDTRKVEFEERTMQDILKLDDGLEDEEAFESVAAISRYNDKLYLSFISPWVKMMMNDEIAEFIRQLHPLRMQRYMCSDLNPFFWPFKFFAPLTKEYRQSVDENNPFHLFEKKAAEAIESSLESYGTYRDHYHERMFKLFYDNPWMKALFPETSKPTGVKDQTVNEQQEKIEKELWKKMMETGGFEAGVIRIILTMAFADNSFDQREFIVAQEVIQQNDRLKKLSPHSVKQLVKEQAAIVAYNKQQAITSLPKILKTKAEKQEAYEIAEHIAMADKIIEEGEQALLDKIKKTLRL